MRLDKFLSETKTLTRSEAGKAVRRGDITVNGKVATKSNMSVETTDTITVCGRVIEYSEFRYIMLNKPEGYVSATEDRDHQTVLELMPAELSGRGLFPAGRLDRDTTGLMIITDDGQLAHNILAPKKHVQKIYHVELDIPVTEEMARGFAEGVELNDGVCKEAGLKITGEYTAKVTLKEGRYHQIKRMFGCYGAKVVTLHRLAMGNLHLPEDLAVGECRELTEEELKLLQQL